jgi:hypothetical protein
MKAEQFRRWCDLTIPALHGLTARQALEEEGSDDAQA